MNDFSILDIQTKSITLVTTYKCTAACEQCCFGCTPQSEGRLSAAQIINAIEQAKRDFPALTLVVFTGGECFLLKDDLFTCIKAATNLGLASRCVTNGYWGKTVNGAKRIAERCAEAGLNELNISTGKDHKKYVPLQSVIQAAEAAYNNNIITLITIESEAADSTVQSEILASPVINELLALNTMGFKVQVNSWMPFTIDAERRKTPALAEGPCNQLFQNIVITPHGQISACCGLTYEHIPEMILGTLNDGSIKKTFAKQLDDFLKIWIKVEGPSGIIRSVLSEENAVKYIESCDHICQLCAIVHQEPEILVAIESDWGNHVDRVLPAFHASMLAEVTSSIIDKVSVE